MKKSAPLKPKVRHPLDLRVISKHAYVEEVTGKVEAHRIGRLTVRVIA